MLKECNVACLVLCPPDGRLPCVLNYHMPLFFNISLWLFYWQLPHAKTNQFTCPWNVTEPY